VGYVGGDVELDLLRWVKRGEGRDERFECKKKLGLGTFFFFFSSSLSFCSSFLG